MKKWGFFRINQYNVHTVQPSSARKFTCVFVNNYNMMFNVYFFKLFIFISLVISTASQGTTPKFLGCYLGENLLSLGEDYRVLPSISSKSCSEFCSEKQYLFFILKNNTCYCSKNYVSRLMKEFDHHCSINCSGNNSDSCGGPPNYVSSYITDITKSGSFLNHGGYPIPIYLGCYTETPNDDENRILKGPAEPYNNNTPQRCSDICFKMGYLFFGVTYGSECWCGNQKPLKSAKVEDSNCDTPCSGDSKLFCGGGWKMGIYSTGITEYTPKKYIGCFEDDTKKTKGISISFQMGKNNSPRRCMNLCNTHQIKYAFVKNNLCECKSALPHNSLMRSFSECNALCPDNPIEYCGGSVTSSVYNTFYSDARGEMTVNHIGCFNSFKKHPILNGWKITISRLTPKECVKSCFSRRFPYAALVSSKECLCSHINPPIDGKTDADMCKIPCSGSSQEMCGGYNAMSVYSTGLKWNTEAIGNYYLGCFEENQNNRIFNGYSKSFTANTPEFCSELCYKFGYSYSGVTYKSECFCGNQPPNDSKFPKVDDKQCNTKCSGDANQFCGGGWRMGVFTTGLQKLPREGQPMGCYVLQEDTLNNMKFELINTNTPLICSAICNNAGYLFSGVTGVNCFCGNRVPDNDYIVGDSECDTVCTSDSSHTCGGEDRVQIYDIASLITKNKTQTSITNFEDEFNSLNLQSLWSHEIYIPQEPDFDFVVYNNIEENSMVKNGELIIKPTIQSDDFIRRGKLELKGCTKKEASEECTKNSSSYNIIPPILSAKLTTKNYFSFLYGQLEVIAKLPIGDWIVSEIAVVSKTNEQNKLILAKLFGNKNLKCNEINEGVNVLKYGLNIDQQYHIKSKMMRSTKTNDWSNEYHSFVLYRTPEKIVFKIDGESNILDTSNLPMDIIFDSEYYISIGVSVGGLTSFDNDCKNNGNPKPWNNFDPKAALNFWKDKNQWFSTWNDVRSTLRVKSVNFTTVTVDNNI